MSLSDLPIVRQVPDPGADVLAPHLDLLGADALSGARRWAVNEVGAMIAHQLAEPLTALLLYMHELKSLTEGFAEATPIGAQKIVEGAVRETERICAIVKRTGNRFDGSADFESTVMRGRDPIWSPSVGADGAPVADAKRAQHDCLTPREREVLDQISGGATNKEGALRLKISPRTFEAHRAEIMRKLSARNTADLLRKVLLDAR
jgi:DNA-binding CsgD family transcriptional regulator